MVTWLQLGLQQNRTQSNTMLTTFAFDIRTFANLISFPSARVNDIGLRKLAEPTQLRSAQDAAASSLWSKRCRHVPLCAFTDGVVYFEKFGSKGRLWHRVHRR